MGQHFECRECGWRGHEDLLVSECVDPGDYFQPPEYEGYCPACGENWDMMDEVEPCISCESEWKQPDSEYCAPCHVDGAEYIMDTR